MKPNQLSYIYGLFQPPPHRVVAPDASTSTSTNVRKRQLNNRPRSFQTSENLFTDFFSFFIMFNYIAGTSRRNKTSEKNVEQECLEQFAQYDKDDDKQLNAVKNCPNERHVQCLSNRNHCPAFHTRARAPALNFLGRDANIP